MLHIMFCDDDKDYILYMQKMVNEILEEESVKIYEYYSGEEMCEKIEEADECDLLFLDMQMPGMDGDEAAKYFREKFPDAVLVFCSGAVTPTTKSFEAEAYRYILKGDPDEVLLKKLKDIMNKVVSVKALSYIAFEDKSGKHVLKVNDIAYVEIVLRGCEINLKKDKDGIRTKIKINKRLTEINEILKDYRFAYSHKSFLVNLELVITVGKTMLELRDGTELPISKQKSKEFKEAYLRYAINK